MVAVGIVLFATPGIAPAGETLYNGIVLPEIWPPRDRDPASRAPMPVPYSRASAGRRAHRHRAPAFGGRFSDRAHHAAANPPHAAEVRGKSNPQAGIGLRAEPGNRPAAAPHSGGAWYDHRENRFKMWYMTGWYGGQALAYSPTASLGRARISESWRGRTIFPTRARASNGAWITCGSIGSPATRRSASRASIFTMRANKAAAGESMLSRDGIHWSAPLARRVRPGTEIRFSTIRFGNVGCSASRPRRGTRSKSRARNYWSTRRFGRGTMEEGGAGVLGRR